MCWLYKERSMRNVRKKRVQDKQKYLQNNESKRQASHNKYWKNPEKQRASSRAYSLLSYWKNRNKIRTSSRASSHTHYWEDSETKRASSPLLGGPRDDKGTNTLTLPHTCTYPITQKLHPCFHSQLNKCKKLTSSIKMNNKLHKSFHFSPLIIQVTSFAKSWQSSAYTSQWETYGLE